MRFVKPALLLALAACSDSSTSDSCPERPISDVVHAPGTLSSGEHLLGVTWSKHAFLGGGEEVHGVYLSPDGTMSPDISLPSGGSKGTPGKTTMLWFSKRDVSTDCGDGLLEPILQTGGAVTFFDLSPTGAVQSSTGVFDGTSYQLFWIEASGVTYHRQISEDGTLGPLHSLGGNTLGQGACVEAVTDGAGTTYLRWVDDVYTVDTANGVAQKIYDAPSSSFTNYRGAFYYNGAFRLHETGRIRSITPTSTTVTNLPSTLSASVFWFPSKSSLYAMTTGGAFEVDTAFAPIRTLPGVTALHEAGTLGDEVLQLHHVQLNDATLTPGGVFLIRDVTNTRQLIELAVDSQPRMLEICGDATEEMPPSR